MGNVIFAASKILWVVAAPGNFLLLVLLFGVVCLVVGKPRHGLAFVLIASLAFLTTATLPVAPWLAAPLENRFPPVTTPPEKVDGIIVLGGAVDPGLTEARGPVSISEAAERITEGVALALRYPKARVLLSGGEGLLFPKGLGEAETTRRLFIELGVAPERIILEDASRNTWENAAFSYRTVQPRPDETWLLVTSAMHMPRAVGCFRRAGWSIVPYPVNFRTYPSVHFALGFGFPGGLDLLNLVIKEWDGLIAYYLLGRTDAFFPAPATSG
jgi:uncharacterized SAM-binding protein YcdF (DUF218 family)